MLVLVVAVVGVGVGVGGDGGGGVMVTVPVGSCGGVSGVDDGSVEHGERLARVWTLGFRLQVARHSS